jgi:uncharacterized FAD-dependent dehydrogenase
MIREFTIRVLPEEAAGEQTLRAAISRWTGDAMETIRAVRVLKRSVDARQRIIYMQLVVRVFINEEPSDERIPDIDCPDLSGSRQVIVVGAGPAGLFAALRLIERGIRPVIIERGKNVHERRRDIALISRAHLVNPESNYCFGEGGAGAYSDGKLYTRSRKRGDVEQILATLCRYGASPSILTDAHPHIGTDKLPRVIERIRGQILRCGGQVHFETCMETLLLRGDEVIGIRTRQGDELFGPVILATGHSARDVYRELLRLGVAMEPKGIAAGVRLEHPQTLIDRIRYRSVEGRSKFLPAAEYRFTARSAGRGVYSFCMCPGGFVVPAASAPGQLAVNGMSPSRRNSRWANAGMVVEIRTEDLADPALAVTGTHSGTGSSPLAMMYFQEKLETLSLISRERSQTAPAQRMDDFLRQRLSATLPATSYTPGVLAYPLHELLPPFIATRLCDGFRQFDRISRGFLTSEAVLIGMETRTSSPVRILRDRDTCRHITFRGLYPCGEGAGYAGGIISAAIDGQNCAGNIP